MNAVRTSAMLVLAIALIAASADRSNAADPPAGTETRTTALLPWKNVAIDLEMRDGRPRAFTVRGLTPLQRQRVGELNESGTAWSDLFAVRVGTMGKNTGQSLPPIFGSYSIDEDLLRFEPRRLGL